MGERERMKRRDEAAEAGGGGGGAAARPLAPPLAPAGEEPRAQHTQPPHTTNQPTRIESDVSRPPRPRCLCTHAQREQHSSTKGARHSRTAPLAPSLLVLPRARDKHQRAMAPRLARAS